MARTARDLSPSELEAYRLALRSRRAVRSDRTSARLAKARDAARHAAALLKRDFGARRVVMLGSLVHPSLFHADSDVDLAVWGLTGKAYFRAVGVLQSIEPGIKVDLIAYEDASPALQAVIRAEGNDL